MKPYCHRKHSIRINVLISSISIHERESTIFVKIFGSPGYRWTFSIFGNAQICMIQYFLRHFFNKIYTPSFWTSCYTFIYASFNTRYLVTGNSLYETSAKFNADDTPSVKPNQKRSPMQKCWKYRQCKID